MPNSQFNRPAPPGREPAPFTPPPRLRDALARFQSIGGAGLPGDVIEQLTDLAVDPLADLTPGAAAIVGAFLSELGGAITEQVREVAYLRLAGLRVPQEQDTGVTFTVVDPSRATVVDTGAVKELFPVSEYPDLYREQYRKAFVKIALPDARRQGQRNPSLTGLGGAP